MITDEQRQAIRAAIKRQTAVNTASPEAALAALVRMGIYTEDGRIAPEYDPDIDVISTRA